MTRLEIPRGAVSGGLPRCDMRTPQLIARGLIRNDLLSNAQRISALVEISSRLETTLPDAERGR